MKINWESFWERVAFIPFHECWEWIGYKTKAGYGSWQGLDRKKYQAHRASLFYHKIKLIDGLVVDHICRNRGCVNPRHLRQVSQSINVLENSVSPTANNVEKTHCPRGHAYDKFRWNKSRNKPARACRTCDNINKMKSYHKRMAEGWRRKK